MSGFVAGVARMSKAKCGKWQSRISLTLIRATILNAFGDLLREPQRRVQQH
jgi:hypothetical protein